MKTKREHGLGVGNGHLERAVDDELAFHIETRTQRLISEGMPPDAARAEAMRQFGNIDAVREDCVAMDQQKERSMNRWDLFNQIREDLRYGLRALRKSWGMSSVAIVTIGVATGVLTTTFSVLNTGYFRPLPYPESDRLVGVNALMRGHSGWWNAVPLEVANIIRHDTRSFERVAVYNGWTSLQLGDQLGSIGLRSTFVDTALFGLVGARAQRGRLFTADEITSNAPVALISDSLWHTRYDRDPSIVGREVRLDGTSRQIVGVLQRGFRFNAASDLWIPLVERPDSVPAAKADWYWLAARRKPDVSLAQARDEVARILLNLKASNPAEYKDMGLQVQSSIVDRTNPAYLTMAALFALVTFSVFLIACTNVGNLLLVRAAERRGEMALRATLGASRARLIRQSLAESAILAAISGVLGAALSVAILRLMLALLPTQGFPSWLQFGFDWRVFLFVTGISIVAILAFGLMPARHGTRVDLVDALKAGGGMVLTDKAVTRGGRRGVVVQIALSLALFVASLFFARSYFFLARFEHGYDADHVLSAYVNFESGKYPTPVTREAAYERVRERLATDGRIEEMALEGSLVQLRTPPGSDPKHALKDSVTGYGIYLPGQADAADRSLVPSGQRHVVTSEYFDLMHIPIVRGRAFGPEDVAGGQNVAIVSQRLASALWGGSDAIGRTFQMGKAGAHFLIIGIAGDVRDPTASFQGTSTAAWPNVYISARQATFWPTMYIRPRAPLASVQAAVESAVRQVNREANVFPLRTMSSNSEGQFLAKTFGLAIGVMALCGTFLAMIGVYGMIAYGVTRRTREIGLRIALGASRDQVVGLFTRQGMNLTGLGLVIGIALGVGVGALTRKFVWGVSLFDPLTYLAAATMFGAIAMFACWLAARRASHVEPSEALRNL